MEALSIESLEQSILGGAVDLSEMARTAPLKTPEEARAEWLQERVGKFTASEFHRLVTCPKKKELPAGAITYCKEKAVELLTEFIDDGYTSAAMQWGIDNELKAVNAFEEKTGLKVEYTGSNQKFITLGSNIGGTPDGLISNHSGIEIKCPNSLTHFKYMGIRNNEDLKNVVPDYYWQIQGLMMITVAPKWHFISYDPRYKKPEHQLHIVEINADMEDQGFLSKRLSMAIDLRDELLKDFTEVNDRLINQSEVMNILKIKRTKLYELRKSGKFPKPSSEVPLLWKYRDIENYALNIGV